MSPNICSLRIDNSVSLVSLINRATREWSITSPALLHAVYGVILSHCGLICTPTLFQVHALNSVGVYSLDYAEDLCLLSYEWLELLSKPNTLEVELQKFRMSKARGSCKIKRNHLFHFRHVWCWICSGSYWWGRFPTQGRVLPRSHLLYFFPDILASFHGFTSLGGCPCLDFLGLGIRLWVLPSHLLCCYAS